MRAELCTLFIYTAVAEERTDMRQIININDNWSFSKGGVYSDAVTLPHTWNAIDGMDGSGEYDRGCYSYTRQLPCLPLREGERVFVEVLAASLSCRVLVNGKETGYHEGGYSSFTSDITDALLPCDPGAPRSNTLTLEVSNEIRSGIYPQMADFTFYGGLYRGVNLLLLPPTHFDVSFHGACGLAITPEVTDAQTAILHLNSWIVNPSCDYTVRYLITDAAGCDVAEVWRPSCAPKTDLLLPSPHLWQGVENPYLYHCTATLFYRNESVDEVSSRFGIRSFSVDPEKGFFLNGKPMMLRGVSRHQDRLWLGNALTKEQHYEDAALIAQLGANTVRLAHYQHSRDFYDACDEYGFIVWAEIPYISSQSDDPSAHENCRQQLQDLIYQNYNHPCICFWGLSNEITIAGEKPGIVENHRELNALVKELDPCRLTTMAHVSMLPMDSPLHGITDLESYNHYFGWYGGTYDKNEKWLDAFHAKHPEICLGLSEYGAEGIITYQPDHPECRDYSESYQAEYHEHMVKILMERPYLWATHVWNMFDFGCAARNEGGTAGRNNKGLVTMDRKVRKEAFYVYKAYWSKEPFVHICGRRYAQRTGETITVRIYSNLPRVSLAVNGVPFATQTADKIFLFENVPLREGFTFLTATALPDNDAPAADAAAPSDSVTLERVASKPEIYTLPREEDDRDGVTNWFETAPAASDEIPTKPSDEHFSVQDCIRDIAASEEAFSILTDALQSMTGMKLKKSMLAMFGSKTIVELSDMLTGFSGDENVGGVPENALQIINAALVRVKKQPIAPSAHGQSAVLPQER